MSRIRPLLHEYLNKAYEKGLFKNTNQLTLSTDLPSEDGSSVLHFTITAYNAQFDAHKFAGHWEGKLPPIGYVIEATRVNIAGTDIWTDKLALTADGSTRNQLKSYQFESYAAHLLDSHLKEMPNTAKSMLRGS